MGLLQRQGFFFSRVWCPPGPFFGCATCVVSWVELWCGLKPTSGCVGSGSTWMGAWCRWMSDAACTGLGLPFWGYHAIFYLWLPLLGLNVLGRGQTVYKGWLPPVLNQNQTQGILMSASNCPPLCYLLRLSALPGKSSMNRL